MSDAMTWRDVIGVVWILLVHVWLLQLDRRVERLERIARARKEIR